MLRSDLCDFSDAYIVVKGTIAAIGTNNKSRKNRPLAFKSNAPFICRISKINNTLIDNAEDLYITISMYNLIEYSKNYRKTTGSLWNYYRDELTDDTNDINFPNKNVINSDSFKIVRKGFPGPIFNAPTPWPSLKVKGILIMTLSTFCQPTTSSPPPPF